jgi:F0F1-type ATP synthase membrane subunit b/b'
MNRRRQESRTHLSVFLSLFLAAAIVAAGGVLHAFYKNRQIQISREIDAIDRRVEQARLDIRTTEMRMDKLLNRFAIRKQVEANGSALRPIPVGVVEEIDATASSRHSVASAAP